MSSQRLSVESVEDAALESLFQRGVRLRLYIAPFVFLVGMSLIAWDPALWRRWAVGLGFGVAGVRLVIEYLALKEKQFRRSRLSSFLPVPAALLLLVVTSTGGVDSPVFVMLPLVTVFLCLFLRPLYGFIFAGLGSVLIWLLVLAAVNGWSATLIPELFGGGARVSNNPLLVTRALFLNLALLWASLIGWLMRSAFQSAIQRALQASDQLLETQHDATKTLTTLAAEIAHELKNPLASVKGLAALVDRDVEGKTKERLDVLRREVDRMQEILESFLNFSRPLVPLDLGTVRLAELAQHVSALHEGLARERGAVIRLDARPEVTVKADARKLKQVLINLVQNALDVTTEGNAVDIVVSFDGPGARVSVMDRGPGVVDAERAFEPGVTTKAQGNGLGLTICRLVARQHGGDVRLSARPDGGTIAELTLPGAPPV